MLRQQRKRKRSEQPHACLADFVAPIASGVADYVGAFAVTAGLGLDRVLSQFRAEHDEYNAILAQALADRLAEALAERLHQLVRREFWGYSAEEQSGPAECLAGDYVGIRPAIGYPACPMHTDKTTLFEMLDVQRAIGIELTEHCMMRPAASVCGWYFAHPESHYLSVGRIGRDQVNDYAARLEIPVTEAERWLSTHLAYAPETKSEMDSTEAIVAREGTLP
jgi:5-methyltetrahydrofolate--homocysteine methyltransferase